MQENMDKRNLKNLNLIRRYFTRRLDELTEEILGKMEEILGEGIVNILL